MLTSLILVMAALVIPSPNVASIHPQGALAAVLIREELVLLVQEALLLTTVWLTSPIGIKAMEQPSVSVRWIAHQVLYRDAP